jgi:adenosylmethionine---8-amino-7-oxononanoate aminotransferase
MKNYLFPVVAFSMHDILSHDRRHVWHPFTQHLNAPAPLPIASASGAELFTPDGRRILDLISSWWVTLHGHCHPAIAGAIARQAAILEQVIFAGCTHASAVTLAARLAALLPGDLNRVFFSDDGSTAVEVALKMALHTHANRGAPERRRLIAFAGGYHGDTVGAMAAGQGSGFFAPYQSLLFPVHILPFPATWQDDPDVEAREAETLAALDRLLDAHGATCAALILEPLVQGAGGMRMCRPALLRAVVERVQAAGILVIFDEVMTGFGRTGTLFACEQVGVVPDMICLSKGLTGGFLPMSVTVCRDGIYEAFLGPDFASALVHGHSYTANPLGCAAALASLDLFESEQTLTRIAAIAASHTAALPTLRAALPQTRRHRQCGTILAFDVTGDAAGEGEGYTAAIGQQLKAAFLERDLLIRPLGNTVYLLPPYCITAAQLDAAYAGLVAVIAAEDTLTQP